MWLSSVLLLALPALISAQQTPSPSLTTSFTTGVSLGPDRDPVTFTQAVTLTVTPTPSGTQSAGNSTASGNSTVSGNATTSTTSTPTNLPTAPTNVNGGGNGPNGAPSPGATAPGGIYGPDDSHVSMANKLKSELGLVAFLALLATVVLL